MPSRSPSASFSTHPHHHSSFDKLRNDPEYSSATIPGYRSPSPDRRRPRLRLTVTLWLLSIFTALVTTPAALQSTTIVLALPVAQSVLLCGVAFGLLATRARRIRGSIEHDPQTTGDHVKIWNAQRWLAIQAGVLSALSWVLALWQARFVDARMWATLEVRYQTQPYDNDAPCMDGIANVPFRLDQIFLFPVVALATFVRSDQRAYSSIPQETLTAATAVTFLVSFSLVRSEIAFSALFIMLMRIGVEAQRWLVLRCGLEGDKRSAFLATSMVVSDEHASGIHAIVADILLRLLRPV